MFLSARSLKDNRAGNWSTRRPRVFMFRPTYTLAMAHTGVVAQAATHVNVRRPVRFSRYGPPDGRSRP